MRSTDAIAAGVLVATMGACHATPRTPAVMPLGGRHELGASFAEVRVHHGIPILQRSFFWDGNGEVEDSGLGFHVGTFLTDRVAIGVGSNLASWWTSGHDIFSLEAEGLLRVHPMADWPVFVDGTAGYQLANDQVPPGGTVWNFTFGFGGGVEVPLAPSTAFLVGLQYHHISNALGRDNDRNPSQNEGRIWVGFEWTF